jgi:anti-sigma-K factor RskA
MNCDEAEELLGAWALDALPPDEAHEMQAHLEGCARHQAVAAELRGAATRIAGAPDVMEPPAALRSRMMSAVAATPQESPAAGARLARERMPDLGAKVVPFRARFSPAWGAVAAALVAAVIGLLAWNVALQRRDEGDVQALARRATAVSRFVSSDGSISGSVLYFGGERKALLVADGLRPLDASKNVYQLWAIADGQPTSLGLVQPSGDGHAVVVVPFDAGSAQVLAMTIEPPGGSPQPTSAPIASAQV